MAVACACSPETSLFPLKQSSTIASQRKCASTLSLTLDFLGMPKTQTNTKQTQNPKPPPCLKNFALSRLVTRGGPRQAHLQDAEDSASFFDGSRRYGVQCRTSRSRPDPQVRFGDCEHDPPSLRCAAREFVLDSPSKRSRKTFAVSFLTRLTGIMQILPPPAGIVEVFPPWPQHAG
jgi:hypothetical protein